MAQSTTSVYLVSISNRTSSLYLDYIPRHQNSYLPFRMGFLEHAWNPFALCVLQQSELAGTYRKGGSSQAPGGEDRYQLVRKNQVETPWSAIDCVPSLRRVQGVQSNGSNRSAFSTGTGLPVPSGIQGFQAWKRGTALAAGR